jgi:hypothetical protein
MRLKILLSRPLDRYVWIQRSDSFSPDPTMPEKEPPLWRQTEAWIGFAIVLALMLFGLWLASA